MARAGSLERLTRDSSSRNAEELIQTLAFKRCPFLNVGCWISRDDLLIIGRLLLVGEFKRVLHGVGLPRESCGLNFGICLKNAVRGPQLD